MKKNLIIYLTVIGLIGFLSSCKKDETRIVISANPVVPTITTIPDLTLSRVNGTDTLTFVGTPADAGFQASVKYFLEACPSGDNFAHVTSILTSQQDIALKITISDLNGIMLKAFPADKATAVDFRIRARLVADAGTGVAPIDYNSPTKTADVTPYGLPRLDLIGSGIDQKIESALGNGQYTGFVNLDVTKPFTIKDPDANVIYGGSGGVLSEGGAALVADATGWSKLIVDTHALTYSLKPYAVGLIGSATPGQWSTDSPMSYDIQTGVWSITVDLVSGFIKFRLNNGWDNGINLGNGDATHPEYTLSNLWNNGSSKDIPITDAGNYTIKLTIGASAYSCTITKN